MVEDASAKSEKRKKTPPDMSQDDRRRLVQELGRKPSQEKVSLYVKSNSAGGSNKQAEDSGAGPEPVESKSGGGDVNGQASSSTKARQMIESMSRRSVDVPTDILLKPIKEDNEELRYLGLDLFQPHFAQTGQFLTKAIKLLQKNTPRFAKNVHFSLNYFLRSFNDTFFSG